MSNVFLANRILNNRSQDARGVQLDGSIQTPNINSHDNGLTISSLSRQINVRAASGISIKSSGGSLSIESGRILTMKSTSQKVSTNASSVSSHVFGLTFAGKCFAVLSFDGRKNRF